MGTSDPTDLRSLPGRTPTLTLRSRVGRPFPHTRPPYATAHRRLAPATGPICLVKSPLRLGTRVPGTGW